MSNDQYSRLELDDYSAASFTSFGKYYFGKLEEIRNFIREIDANKRNEDSHKSLLSAFRAYEAGQTNITHNVAFREVPLLVPAQIIHTEGAFWENYEWEHLNTWRWPYNMRCDTVKSTHFWVRCDQEYRRVVKAEFGFLRYEGLADHWNLVGDMLWGFPCMLTGHPAKFYNVLAEPEKVFQSVEEMEADWLSFQASPDPDYTEFCNDIFGDG